MGKHAAGEGGGAANRDVIDRRTCGATHVDDPFAECSPSSHRYCRAPASVRPEGPMKATPTMIGLCCVLAACPRDASPPDTATDTAVASPEVTCDEYVEQGLAVRARTREEFRAALGEPEQIGSEATPNRHDPSVTDTIFRLHYPGLIAQIRRPAPGGDLLEQVEVVNNQHLTYPTLGMGATAEQITSALGAPQESTEGRLLYVCGAEIRPEEPVIFLLANGRVAEVRFTWYVD